MASGSAPIRTTTSRSSILLFKARAAAWSIRRCSPPAHGGLAPRRDIALEEVTIHEAGHQWWYGVVGSNEFEHAWMDEGINQFSEARADDVAFGANNYLVRRYFGGFVPWVFKDIRVQRHWDEGISGYRVQAESDAEATPSFRYWPSTGGNITYFKTALWLHTARELAGMANAAARNVRVFRPVEIPSPAAVRFLPGDR
jgi:hypothetical protein